MQTLYWGLQVCIAEAPSPACALNLMLLRSTDTGAFHGPNQSLGVRRWGTGHKYFLEAGVESRPT